MKRVCIVSICICSILLFSLTGCGKQQGSDINDKLDSELEYVENLIFKIANKYAKGEYIEDDKIRWDYIKNDVNRINDSWDTLILDLIEVNVSNEVILGFSDDLNNLLIMMAQEDDVAMIDKLNDMYAKIIIFKQSYSQDKNRIQENKIKSEVLAIFNLANKNDFDTAKVRAESVINNYKELMNNASYAEENSYHLNKTYILLEEYKNSIQTENYDLIRMKYITTIENL